jgi:hypothetical protein
MIQLPRRSVTRFFIPLIDVLTLLFCIFLMLPLVGEGSPPEPGTPAATSPAPDRHSPQTMASLLEREREELRQLRQEKVETLQKRLTIHVLEIDADTGKLYYHDPESRIEIANQAQARGLIDRHRQEAPGRELYYLFLFPRRITGYPEQRQVQQYERWFESVAHGIDNPRGARGGREP